MAKLEPFEWYFWLIQGKGKTILVDTGFNSVEKLKKWRFTRFLPPEKKLLSIGIAPPEITDIVLTHAHWDHIGRIGLYKNARIWMQAREYNYMREILSAKASAKGMDYRDLKALNHIKGEGRLQLLNGAHTLTAGIKLIPGGAHTPGSQYVVVETIDGNVVLAGDTAYFYDNIFKHIPTGSNIDAEANLAAIHTFQKLAASPFFIIPGHDPRVRRKFPLIQKGIVKIAAETK